MVEIENNKRLFELLRQNTDFFSLDPVHFEEREITGRNAHILPPHDPVSAVERVADITNVPTTKIVQQQQSEVPLVYSKTTGELQKDRNGDGRIDQKDEELKKQQEVEAKALAELIAYEASHGISYSIFSSPLMQSFVDAANASIAKNTKLVEETLNQPEVQKNLVLKEGETKDDVVNDFRKKSEESSTELVKKIDNALASGDIGPFFEGAGHLDELGKAKVKEWFKNAGDPERREVLGITQVRVNDCTGELVYEFKENAEYLKEQKILTSYCLGGQCTAVREFESGSELYTQIMKKISEKEKILESEKELNEKNKESVVAKVDPELEIAIGRFRAADGCFSHGDTDTISPPSVSVPAKVPTTERPAQTKPSVIK